MVVSILPIIVSEALVLSMGFGLALWPSTWVVSVANVASTLIGVPVTWFLLFVIEIVVGVGRFLKVKTAKQKFLAIILGSAFIPPHGDRAVNWMAPASCLVLLVPFFFASWLIERQVVAWFLDDFNFPAITNGVLTGNLISYGILAAIVAAWTIRQYLVTTAEIKPSVSENVTVEKASGKRKGFAGVAKQAVDVQRVKEGKTVRKGLILKQGGARKFEIAKIADEFHGRPKEAETAVTKHATADE